MAPLVAMVASVASSPPKSDSAHAGSRLEGPRRVLCTRRGSASRSTPRGRCEGLAYAMGANRAAAIAAGAVEALEAATRRDRPRRRSRTGLRRCGSTFASASALAKAKPRGREEA